MPDLPGRGGLLEDALAALGPVPLPRPPKHRAQGGPNELQVLSLRFRKHDSPVGTLSSAPCQPARTEGQSGGWHPLCQGWGQ